MKTVLATSLVLAALAAAWTSTATADTFQLTTTGGDPELTVDGNGTGHFVWNEGRRGEPDLTRYCQVPRGGTACTTSHTFVPAGNSPTNNVDFSGPKVFVAGSTVVVMTERCCGGFPPGGSSAVIIYVSTDAGATFGPQQVVGDANIAGDAIVGPGPRLSTISDVVTGGTFYQAHTAGTYNELDANLGNSGPSQSYSGSLALIDPNTPIATFDDLDTTFWRRYDGSGDPNDVANWTPTTAVGPGEDGQLAYGPNGVWLLYLTGSPGDATYVARQFNGAGFGAPVSVTETGGPIFADFFQDPSGRFHAVWLDGSRDLVYRRSENGTEYGITTQLAESSFSIFHLKVGAGADGEGWVAWDANSNTGVVAAAELEVAQEPPRVGRTVAVDTVKGEVFVKLPPAARASQKGSGFVPLTEARTIPVRSILDTRKGTVALRVARNRRGRIQSGRFSAGVFKVLQSRKRKAKGLTTLSLKGRAGKFRRCRRGKAGAAEPRADAARKRRRLSRRAIRRLRAKAKGRYRTRGRRSAATVRGTTWTVTDSCAGTLTKVKRGKVAVRDFRRKKTVVLTRGKRYLAKAPR